MCVCVRERSGVCVGAAAACNKSITVAITRSNCNTEKGRGTICSCGKYVRGESVTREQKEGVGADRGGGTHGRGGCDRRSEGTRCGVASVHLRGVDAY